MLVHLKKEKKFTFAFGKKEYQGWVDDDGAVDGADDSNLWGGRDLPERREATIHYYKV